jgi:hypothetical protein
MYSIPAVCSWLGMIFSLTLLSRSSLALPILLARCWHTPTAYLSMAALWVEFAKGLPEPLLSFFLNDSFEYANDIMTFRLILVQ